MPKEARVGKVIDPDGAPVSGASVALDFPHDFWSGKVGGDTDARGAVTLRDVDPLRTYDLRVKPPSRLAKVLVPTRVETWKPVEGPPTRYRRCLRSVAEEA